MGNIFKEAAKQLHQSPSDVQPYIATLSTHCVTTEKTLRGVGNDDLRTMGIPDSMIIKIRQIIGQDDDWGDNDARPQFYSRSYNEKTR